MEDKRVWFLRAFVVIALVMLAAASLALTQNTVQAGDNGYAYLYNGMTGELVRVNFLDGAQESFDLGLPEGVFVGGYDMVLDSTGSRFAFCQTILPEGESVPQARLIVRDLAAGVNILEQDFGTAIGCKAGAFNTDETQITVGKVNYFPGDPNTDPGDGSPMWDLLVLDIASGTTVQHLDSTDPLVAQAGMMTDMPLIPLVRVFDDSGLTFVETPYGVGGVFQLNAFRWTPGSAALEPVPYWGEMVIDYLETTGEFVWAAIDPNLASGQPMGPMGAFNVLKVADASGERTIYHEAEWTISVPRFINDGQQIAVMLYPPFNPDAPNEIPNPRWIAIDRSGAVTDIGTSVEYSDVANAPGGYALLTVAYSGDNYENTTYTLTHHAGAEVRTLWTADTSGWELVWTSPPAYSMELAPFPAVTP
ncbi:MAG: hypothetical protein JW966_01965 [Anaerolineae bacterium]|nr:hypothetical protein [Anaerolineae bacterium]